jgi:hypothetical protein
MSKISSGDLALGILGGSGRRFNTTSSGVLGTGASDCDGSLSRVAAATCAQATVVATRLNTEGVAIRVSVHHAAANDQAVW